MLLKIFLTLVSCSLIPLATLRLYLSAVKKTADFSLRLQDEIWEWPGDEAKSLVPSKPNKYDWVCQTVFVVVARRWDLGQRPHTCRTSF